MTPVYSSRLSWWCASDREPLAHQVHQFSVWPLLNGIGDLVSLKRITVRSVSQSLALCFQGDEDKQIFFHGVAYVNMVPLLCPGVKQIRGAFRVFTYQDSEVFEKVRADQTARLCSSSAAVFAQSGIGSRQHGQRGIWEQAAWAAWCLGAGSMGSVVLGDWH